MSVVEAVARVAEIRSLLEPLAGLPARAESRGDFGATLAAAQGARGSGSAPGVQSVHGATSGGASAVPEELRSLIEQAARASGVDPALVAAVARAESNFDPRAGSPAGAQGLMQLMPATARGLGVSDPYDPAQSLNGGARYLRGQLDRFDGDVRLALAAYNAGPGAVQRYGGVPPYAETQAYVPRVLGYYEQLRGAFGAWPSASGGPGG